MQANIYDGEALEAAAQSPPRSVLEPGTPRRALAVAIAICLLVVVAVFSLASGGSSDDTLDASFEWCPDTMYLSYSASGSYGSPAGGVAHGGGGWVLSPQDPTSADPGPCPAGGCPAWAYWPAASSVGSPIGQHDWTSSDESCTMQRGQTFRTTVELLDDFPLDTLPPGCPGNLRLTGFCDTLTGKKVADGDYICQGVGSNGLLWESAIHLSDSCQELDSAAASAAGGDTEANRQLGDRCELHAECTAGLWCGEQVPGDPSWQSWFPAAAVCQGSACHAAQAAERACPPAPPGAATGTACQLPQFTAAGPEGVCYYHPGAAAAGAGGFDACEQACAAVGGVVACAASDATLAFLLGSTEGGGGGGGGGSDTLWLANRCASEGGYPYIDLPGTAFVATAGHPSVSPRARAVGPAAAAGPTAPPACVCEDASREGICDWLATAGRADRLDCGGGGGGAQVGLAGLCRCGGGRGGDGGGGADPELQAREAYEASSAPDSFYRLLLLAVKLPATALLAGWAVVLAVKSARRRAAGAAAAAAAAGGRHSGAGCRGGACALRLARAAGGGAWVGDGLAGVGLGGLCPCCDRHRRRRATVRHRGG
eukprot:SAG22_NODE_1554_length_4137_cov_3.159485_4_plen_598_part_00